MADKYTTFEQVTPDVCIDCTIGDNPVWKVYRKTMMPSTDKGENGEPVLRPRMMPVGKHHETRELALAAAKSLK